MLVLVVMLGLVLAVLFGLVLAVAAGLVLGGLVLLVPLAFPGTLSGGVVRQLSPELAPIIMHLNWILLVCS